MADTMTKKESTSEEQENLVSQGARMRSPAYPGINLETAIKRAGEIYAQEKMNAVPIAIAVRRWGFKEKSSGGLITVAALKSFGLTRDSGSGKDRKIQLTDDARRILLDTRADSKEREQLIKQVAMNPKIHSTLWKKWGLELPSDDTLRHTLIFDFSFNENSVGDFIKEYKDTIRFAKLADSDMLSNSSKDLKKIQIGDYVEWEAGGVLQFESKRVTSLSEEGDFAFVEGSSTGLPLNELRKVPSPLDEDQRGHEAKLPPFKRVQLRPGMNNEIFTLEEGEVVLQWPSKMSKESYEDFKGWLDLIAKKVKRTTEKKESTDDQASK